MTEPLSFISPFSLPECIQRLNGLAEKKHFRFSSGRFVAHVKIHALETSDDSFNLFITCNPQRFELPAFVFFKLIGELQSTEKGTKIQLGLQRHKPTSKSAWAYLLFWSFILVIALIGGIIAIMSSTLLQGVLIGLVFILAGMGYAWVLYQTYRLGMKQIPKLVYKTLGGDANMSSSQYDEERQVKF